MCNKIIIRLGIFVLICCKFWFLVLDEIKTVPPSKKKRVCISLRLKDATFENTFTNKHSSEYKDLRNKVEDAVSDSLEQVETIHRINIEHVSC